MVRADKEREYSRATHTELGTKVSRLNYFPLELEEEEDAAFSWIKPIPKPPTAPASSPKSTSTGTVSSRAFFFFTISYSPGAFFFVFLKKCL
jgi:hypothetical protein